MRPGWAHPSFTPAPGVSGSKGGWQRLITSGGLPLYYLRAVPPEGNRQYSIEAVLPEGIKQ